MRFNQFLLSKQKSINKRKGIDSGGTLGTPAPTKKLKSLNFKRTKGTFIMVLIKRHNLESGWGGLAIITYTLIILSICL